MLNGDATKMKETKNNKAVLNFDEENEITIIGYRLVYWKWFLTMVAMIGSAGLLWLLLYWMPQWKLWWTHEQAQFIYLDSTFNYSRLPNKHRGTLGYVFPRGYVYCFSQMFQWLRLFKGVHLFRSLE